MDDKQRILIVDDEPRNIKVAANALHSDEIIIGFAKSGQEAFQRLEESDFDLILLDVMMPDMDGFEVCERLKQNPDTSNIPVLFITARTDEDSIEKAYEVGGTDYICKPFRTRELMARVKAQLRQIKLIRRLEFLATRDSLTGIFNRRKFFESGELLLDREELEIAAMMIDVDFFKKVNDNYGHDAGDIVLKSITKIIDAALPDKAIFGRLGGEEFAVLLPATNREEAMQYAETIRQDVANTAIDIQNDRTLNCTVSIGLEVKQEIVSLDALLKMADDGLYQAKQQGRNRTISRDSNEL